MVRTSNKKASFHVRKREEFKGSNTFGRWEGKDIYAVYSYGEHFPIYVYNDRLSTWYENSEKFSSSTSKQQTQLHPGCECLKDTTEGLKKIIKNHKQ